MASLFKIRERIAQIKDQIHAVTLAQPPFDDQVAILRRHLEDMTEPVDALVERCADVLVYGHPVGDVTGHPDRTAHNALAAALAALGTEHILAAAIERARAADANQGILRMAADERAERLQELRQKLYALEIEEEAARGKESRRADVSAGVLLGLSYEQAEERGLI